MGPVDISPTAAYFSGQLKAHFAAPNPPMERPQIKLFSRFSDSGKYLRSRAGSLGHIGEVLRPAVGQVCVKLFPTSGMITASLCFTAQELNGRFAHVIGMVPAAPMQEPQGLEFLPLRDFSVKAFKNGQDDADTGLTAQRFGF